MSRSMVMERELRNLCKQYAITRNEIAYGRRANGRPRENCYVQMVRGIFIYRASRYGALPVELAELLGMSERAVKYWRAELFRRGIIEKQPGRLRGRPYTRRKKAV